MSVKFAGQDIFLEALRQRPELLSVVDRGGKVSEVIRVLRGRYKRGNHAYDAEIDALITAYGDDLLEKLPGCSKMPGVAEFLQILELGLCGMGFYTGLLVGHLVQEGAEMPKRIPIFVGGNGSRLFNWCAPPVPDPESVIMEKFSRSFLAGANFGCENKLSANRVDVALSQRPKDEVAFGLVMKPVRLESSDAYVNPIAGEDYLVGKTSSREKRAWNSSPDMQVLGTQPVQVDPELMVFRKFLAAMKISLNEDELDNVATAVDKGIDTMSRKAAQAIQRREDDDETAQRDPVRKQPLFILALKSLLGSRLRKLNTIRLPE
jgi:hypothetical protein